MYQFLVTGCFCSHLICVSAAAHLLIALVPSNSFRQSFRSSRNLVSPHKEAILVCKATFCCTCMYNSSSSSPFNGPLSRSMRVSGYQKKHSLTRKPHIGLGHPFPSFSHPCPFTSPIFCVFLLFPFSFSRSLYLFSSFVHPIPFSTRVVQLRFQARGRRRRPNLVLVCSVYFVLSVLFT